MDYLNWQPPIKTKKGWKTELETTVKIGSGDVRKNLTCGVREKPLLEWGGRTKIHKQEPKGNSWHKDNNSWLFIRRKKPID